MSLISTAWVVPSVIGPFIAGGLTEFVSWRWAFLSIAPPVPPPLTAGLPPTPPPVPRRGDQRVLCVALGLRVDRTARPAAAHRRPPTDGDHREDGGTAERT